MDKTEEIQKQRNKLNHSNIIVTEELINNTEKNILALKDNVEEMKIEKEMKYNFSQKIKYILRRLDVSSGLNFVKLLFWVGMADIIIFLSADIETKIISAFTYFLGIIFDVLLLRKQQMKDGTVVLRFVEGCLLLVFIVFSIILVIGLAACSLNKTLPGWYEMYIDWIMPICGILSTSMELINSLCEDD